MPKLNLNNAVMIDHPSQQSVNQNALIQLQGVGVVRDGRAILKQIDLSLAPHEIVSLIGPNGAGKSTLVKVVLGIISADSGQVQRAQHLKMAYVPQQFKPSNSLPLRVTDLLNLERCTTQHRTQIIAETSIETLLNKDIRVLSGGERQRVLLARALLRQPNLLVLDEPMQGLDLHGEAELYRYVASLPQRYGCAILMVSHDLQWVMQGTQRVVCLNKHICCSGLPDSVQAHPEYQAIFGTQRVLYHHHHDHCGHLDDPEPCAQTSHPHLHPETDR